MPARKRKAPASDTPVPAKKVTPELENIDAEISAKLANIIDPEELFWLAEADLSIYRYILQTPTLFEKLCTHLNPETLSKVINNTELFTLLFPHHLVTLGKLRPEIIKEIMDHSPWAFDFLTGDDLVSLSKNNPQTVQEILRSATIRQRFNQSHLITLYQADPTGAVLLEIVSYADLFKLIKLDTLPLEDANYVYENIDIHTLFNHAREDNEIYQIILNNPALLERIDELSEEMIDDDLLLCCPPDLLVRFGILYPKVASKVVRFCVFFPSTLLTGNHFTEIGKSNPQIAREILKNIQTRKRLDRNNLLTLCKEDKTLFLEISGYSDLSELLFSEKLSAEDATQAYRDLDPDKLFDLAEKYKPVYRDILRDLSLFTKICRKPTLTRGIVYNGKLREQLSLDHVAILVLLDPIVAEIACKKLSAFPTIDNFVSIGKNDPDMTIEILKDPDMRKQLKKENLLPLFQNLSSPLRGQMLLEILSYPDLFKLIDLAELPKKDVEYVYAHMDRYILLAQAKKDPEIYQRILNDLSLFDRLCSAPEVKSEILKNPDLHKHLTKAHSTRLNLGLFHRFTSKIRSLLIAEESESEEEAPAKKKSNNEKRLPSSFLRKEKNESASEEETPSKKRKLNHTIKTSPSSLLIAYQQTAGSSNTLPKDNEDKNLWTQSRKRNARR